MPTATGYAGPRPELTRAGAPPGADVGDVPPDTAPDEASDEASDVATGRGPGHLPYAAGLDGVRALAVAAVVVFHLGAPWLPGGFLGVDVFFTLSGFLITTILLREFGATGRVDIGRFYLRRARRLLPALLVLLAVVTVVTWLFARDEVHRLRGDVVAALTYSTNWTQIGWGRGYFEQLGRPSLLQHLWSLAVEEQFYLVWPLLLVACLAARPRWVLPAVPAGLAAASLLLMAVLFHPGGDPVRVYYGSDTHVAPMLVGALLAILGWRRGHARHRRAAGDTGGATGRALSDVVALAGAAGLLWAALEVDSYGAGLYRGGYLLVALCAAALVHGAGRAGTLTARVLGTRPLVWVGQRSYAIYLWHWPVLVLTRPGVDTTWPTPVVVTLQVGVVLLAADLSYRYVEVPIRTHGFRHVLGGPAPADHSGTVGRASTTRRVTLATVLLGVPALVVMLGATSAAPAGIQVDRTHPRVTITVAPTSPAAAAPRPAAPGAVVAASAPPPFARPVRVSFFGDSQGMTLLINKPDGLAGSMTLSDSTVEGCGVLLGTISSSTGYRRDLAADCGSWPQQWAEHAAANTPQVAVVEIGAWDVFDVTVDGATLTFGTPAWDAYFTRQLAQGVDILTRAGAQVALLGVPCYRPVAAGGLPVLPERGDDSRTRHLNTLLAAAAARQPARVFTVEPPAAFCNDPQIATDTAYRWDGTHYYVPGAALMFQTITPQLLAVPQPPH